MSWRFVNAAVRGTSHALGDTPCQDDCLIDLIGGADDHLLLAVASDGAGSASRAEEGSGIVCEVLRRRVEAWQGQGGRVPELTRETVEQWIASVREAIAARAGEAELKPRDFACTLVAAVVATDAAAFFQIGDGAIVAGSGDATEVIFWPDGGEYANMTYFTTDDDWQRHLHFEVRAGAIDDLAVMTDGLQRLALQFDSRAPYQPFFAPMFAALRGAAPGFADDLEPGLAAFLASEAVNARTDDDKSLVLATRRTEGVHGAA